jgi:hypothetical protein
MPFPQSISILLQGLLYHKPQKMQSIPDITAVGDLFVECIKK